MISNNARSRESFSSSFHPDVCVEECRLLLDRLGEESMVLVVVRIVLGKLSIK